MNQFKINFQFIAVFGLLILLSSCGGSASIESNPMKDAMNKTKEAAAATKNAAQSAMDKTKEAAMATKDAANGVMEDAKGVMDGAKGVMDDAKNVMGDAKEASKGAMKGVAETATKAKEAMKAGAATTANKAKEMVDKTEKAIDRGASSVKETMTTKSAEAVTTSTRQATSQASTSVRQAASKATSSTSRPAASGMKDKATNMKDKASTITDKPKASKPAPVGVNHEVFDQLLRKHVSESGSVNYAAFKSDMGKLDGYLNQLSQNPVQSNWPSSKQLVYWINAYNAHTIKLILNNYPVAKITDLEGGKPWDKKWIKLGDKTYSLNNIENDIIRPQFKEPRIHFAVNCAAKSCPSLLNRAWTEANLEKYFELQTKKFVNNATFNQISSSEATLSKIFEWYGEDFGDLKTFINKYSNTKLDAKSNVKFMDYNWNLNGK